MAEAFRYNESCLIPLEPGQAVNKGWMQALGGKPLGVTWHWTATWDLKLCRDTIGGANAERKGVATAHYGVGRTFAEGVDRYVTLENRAWHAGKEQTLRWDGKPLTDPNFKGSRSTVGVETVNIGYATGSIKAGPDWIPAHSPDGRSRMLVQPWTDEQLVMMTEVGREIVARWPHIGVRDHHGHHDVCPGYKVDVTGFPFARLLRGIYPGQEIPDVWSPCWTAIQRQRILSALGHDPGPSDGKWGPRSAAALRAFQQEQKMVANGMWSTFTCWRAHELLQAGGRDLAEVGGAPA